MYLHMHLSVCVRLHCMYQKWWFPYGMDRFPAIWLANGYHGRLGGSGILIPVWVDIFTVRDSPVSACFFSCILV